MLWPAPHITACRASPRAPVRLHVADGGFDRTAPLDHGVQCSRQAALLSGVQDVRNSISRKTRLEISSFAPTISTRIQ